MSDWTENLVARWRSQTSRIPEEAVESVAVDSQVWDNPIMLIPMWPPDQEEQKEIHFGYANQNHQWIVH